MVRINLIEPVELSDQHLIAEQVEILMLMSYIQKHPKMDGTEPKEFTLNKGHMKFFRDKVLYLHKRYTSILNEMVNRGFKITWKFPDINEIPIELYNDYKPDQKALNIINERINERIMKKPLWYRYRRQKAYAWIVGEKC